MPLFQPVTIESANDKQKPILEKIKAKLGKVPNIYGSLAHSPATLKGMLQYKDHLAEGVLSAQEIEAIALSVAQKNKCDYCVAAHSTMGKMAGLTDEKMLSFRKGEVQDAKLDAIVKLSLSIVKNQGYPTQEVKDAFYAAGYAQDAFIEVIAWVTYNLFTNYFNHAVNTEVDFPRPANI